MTSRNVMETMLGSRAMGTLWDSRAFDKDSGMSGYKLDRYVTESGGVGKIYIILKKLKSAGVVKWDGYKTHGKFWIDLDGVIDALFSEVSDEGKPDARERKDLKMLLSSIKIERNKNNKMKFLSTIKIALGWLGLAGIAHINDPSIEQKLETFIGANFRGYIFGENTLELFKTTFGFSKQLLAKMTAITPAISYDFFE